MKLKRMNIHGYRSIRDASLDECGDLNVLIGKNNAGKSNVLSAIQAFFEFFSADQGIATLNPKTTGATDWFAKNAEKIITITAVLGLTPDEAARIREAMADEVPQMRNALDDMFAESGSVAIECDLVFRGAPKRIGYLSRISLITAGTVHQDPLLGLDFAAAGEIADREEEIRNLRANGRMIQRVSSELDTDDFRMMKDESSRASRGYFLARRIPTTSEVYPTINRFLRESDSLEVFRERALTHAEGLMDRSEQLLARPNSNAIKTFSGTSSTIPVYIKTIVSIIGSLKVHHLPERRQVIGEKEASRVLNLKMSRGQGHVLRELQTTVSDLLGVQIDAFSSDRPSRGAEISAELDVDDFLVQVNGSGIREALRLMLDYEFERPDILLVEEPEVHLHPALETAMMQYLRRISHACTIFLTTHSTNFLDIADLQNVYLVTKDDSTRIQLLDAAEAEEAIPQELGIRLSSLFLYDRLVFVEGPSDEQVLRTFASTLGVNLGQAGIGFVSTGGARNFAYYANASTLSFLKKRGVKLYFILDRDERDLPEVSSLQEMLGGLGKLHVLQRRELENYLISPGPLAKCINIKAGKPVVQDLDQVGEALKEASTELLNLTIERQVLRLACKPVIPNRDKIIGRGDQDFVSALEAEIDQSSKALSDLRENISAWLDESTQAMKNTNVETRLHMIPGDSIIDFIFNKFDVRFNKRKDGPRIAAQMEAGEIPSEINQLLHDLTR